MRWITGYLLLTSGEYALFVIWLLIVLVIGRLGFWLVGEITSSPENQIIQKECSSDAELRSTRIARLRKELDELKRHQ